MGLFRRANAVPPCLLSQFGYRGWTLQVLGWNDGLCACTKNVELCCSSGKFRAKAATTFY